MPAECRAHCSCWSGWRPRCAYGHREALLFFWRLHPLRSIDELLSVLETQLEFPEGMPHEPAGCYRSCASAVSTELELTQLIEQLEASGGWAEALDKPHILPEHRVVLVWRDALPRARLLVWLPCARAAELPAGLLD